jgi:hypothetical protein
MPEYSSKLHYTICILTQFTRYLTVQIIQCFIKRPQNHRLSYALAKRDRFNAFGIVCENQETVLTTQGRNFACQKLYLPIGRLKRHLSCILSSYDFLGASATNKICP